MSLLLLSMPHPPRPARLLAVGLLAACAAITVTSAAAGLPPLPARRPARMGAHEGASARRDRLGVSVRATVREPIDDSRTLSTCGHLETCAA